MQSYNWNCKKQLSNDIYQYNIFEELGLFVAFVVCHLGDDIGRMPHKHELHFLLSSSQYLHLDEIIDTEDSHKYIYSIASFYISPLPLIVILGIYLVVRSGRLKTQADGGREHKFPHSV